MAALRGARQLLRVAQPLGSASIRYQSQSIQLLHHVAGLTQQASLVDTQSSRSAEDSFSHASTSKFASKVDKEPLQILYDEQSGVTITTYPSTVSITSPKHGLTNEYHFHHVWLRDICTEANSIEQATKQKLFHTSDIHIPSSDSTIGLLNE